ncbi:MAG: flagellar basal body P-ring formation chaperone FlgA [Janthinobacterium lividum]
MRKPLRQATGLLVAAMLVVSLDGSLHRARAVSLRNHVMVHGNAIKLSDLFSGLSPGQDCEIGPSPAPGKRIVVPPVQLAAIASEFGVDWQAGAGYAAAVLERQARPVTREEILSILKPALLADGVPAGSDVSLGAFATPLLPAEMTAAPEIQSLDRDPQSGRFSAVLLFAAADTEPVSLRVVGRLEQRVSVLALSHPMPAGSLVSAADVQMVRVPIAGLRGVPLTSIAEASGLSLRRPLGDNVPLMRDMLVKAMLVDRGRPVVLRLQSGGLALTAAGTALEAGAAGDSIHVVNSLSHAILVGRIIDSADIQIDAGTAPLIAQANGQTSSLPRILPGASVAARGWPSGLQEASN